MKMRATTVLGFSLMALLSTAHAGGLIINDEEIRRDLNWLATRHLIDSSVSTWPLTEDEILAALAGVQQSATGVPDALDQAAIDRITSRIARQKNHFVLQAGISTDTAFLPPRFDEPQKAQHQVAGTFNARDTHWEIQLKASAQQHPRITTGKDVTVDGSYVAGLVFNQWLIAGALPTWWGPGHDGSLIRSDAAHAVIGITAQRNRQTPFTTPWLAWLGPWQYQLFAGQLQDYQTIPDAKLLGMRMNVQPAAYLELGAMRTVQWGGQGRPQSFDSLLKALTGMQDNNDPGQQFPDPSNQLGGLDVKLRLLPLVGLPLNLYGQAIGEDEAGGLPAKYLQLLGIEGVTAWQDKGYQWHMEYANTKTNLSRMGASYTHGTYTDGYYQHGYPLGHAIGGDGQMLTVGLGSQWDSKHYLGGRVVLADVNPNNQLINRAYPNADRITGLELNWRYQHSPLLNVKTNVWLVNAKHHQSSDGGLGVAIEMPFDMR